MEHSRYLQWRSAKLNSYPYSAEALQVEIGGLTDLSEAEKVAILDVCSRSNMAIYKCRDRFSDPFAVRDFAARFGLRRPDVHLCANDNGVSELTAVASGHRSGYVPYSNRSLSWHTDGYYNSRSSQVNAVVLHCANAAGKGGENTLLDHEIAYIYLRDKEPRFITALEHPQCMTIPANIDDQVEIRPSVSGPVFSYSQPGGNIHMRFSARKMNIQWREDSLTTEAREYLAEILADENGPVLRYRLRPGEGLISNNVLHNRTAFVDSIEFKRLLYRARFLDRIGTY